MIASLARKHSTFPRYWLHWFSSFARGTEWNSEVPEDLNNSNANITATLQTIITQNNYRRSRDVPHSQTSSKSPAPDLCSGSKPMDAEPGVLMAACPSCLGRRACIRCRPAANTQASSPRIFGSAESPKESVMAKSGKDGYHLKAKTRVLSRL